MPELRRNCATVSSATAAVSTVDISSVFAPTDITIRRSPVRPAAYLPSIIAANSSIHFGALDLVGLGQGHFRDARRGQSGNVRTDVPLAPESPTKMSRSTFSTIASLMYHALCPIRKAREPGHILYRVDRVNSLAGRLQLGHVYGKGLRARSFRTVALYRVAARCHYRDSWQFLAPLPALSHPAAPPPIR